RGCRRAGFPPNPSHSQRESWTRRLAWCPDGPLAMCAVARSFLQSFLCDPCEGLYERAVQACKQTATGSSIEYSPSVTLVSGAGPPCCGILTHTGEDTARCVSKRSMAEGGQVLQKVLDWARGEIAE